MTKISESIFIFMMISSVAAGVEHVSAKENDVIFRGKHVQLILPEHPLADGAVQVQSHLKGRRFVDWTREEGAEAYELMQKIVKLWEKGGITNYMVLGEENPEKPFSWEMVPYPTEGIRFWKQFKVVWRLFVDSATQSDEKRNRQRDEFKKVISFLGGPDGVSPPDVHPLRSDDAFCKDSVIVAQKVVDEEDKSVRVLYDYRPLSKHHFLIVTKEHREKFSDLPLKGFLEASEYAQTLLKKYGKPELPAYLYFKTGKEAGQTVPHWHMHVIQTDEEGALAKFGKVLLNMTIGYSPLSKNELEARVKTFRQELNSSE